MKHPKITEDDKVHLIVMSQIEKKMRKCIHDIHEKGKILQKRGRAYKQIEASYQQSMTQLTEYTKHRDSLAEKIREQNVKVVPV